jgi:hypothetical protein
VSGFSSKAEVARNAFLPEVGVSQQPAGERGAKVLYLDQRSVEKSNEPPPRTKLPRAAVSVDFLIYWLQRVAVPAAFFDLLCHTGRASPLAFIAFFSLTGGAFQTRASCVL